MVNLECTNFIREDTGDTAKEKRITTRQSNKSKNRPNKETHEQDSEETLKI